MTCSDPSCVYAGKHEHGSDGGIIIRDNALYNALIGGDMTFEEFWVDYSATYQHAATTQRTGQYFFNRLYDFRPDLADQIRGTEYDPFYDDLKVPKAAAKVCELWNRD